MGKARNVRALQQSSKTSTAASLVSTVAATAAAVCCLNMVGMTNNNNNAVATMLLVTHASAFDVGHNNAAADNDFHDNIENHVHDMNNDIARDVGGVDDVGDDAEPILAPPDVVADPVINHRDAKGKAENAVDDGGDAHRELLRHRSRPIISPDEGAPQNLLDKDARVAKVLGDDAHNGPLPPPPVPQREGRVAHWFLRPPSVLKQEEMKADRNNEDPANADGQQQPNHRAFDPAGRGDVNNYYIDNYYNYPSPTRRTRKPKTTMAPATTTAGPEDPLVSNLASFVAMYKAQQTCFSDYWRLCRPVRTTTTRPPTTTTPAPTTGTPPLTSATTGTETPTLLPTNVTETDFNTTTEAVITTDDANATTVDANATTVFPTTLTETDFNTTTEAVITTDTNATTLLPTNFTETDFNTTTEAVITTDTNATTLLPTTLTETDSNTTTEAVITTDAANATTVLPTNFTFTETDFNTTEVNITDIGVNTTEFIPDGLQATLVPPPSPTSDAPTTPAASMEGHLHGIVHAHMMAQQQDYKEAADKGMAAKGRQMQEQNVALSALLSAVAEVTESLRQADGSVVGAQHGFKGQQVSYQPPLQQPLVLAHPSWGLERCLADSDTLFKIRDDTCRNYMSGVAACASAVRGLGSWWDASQGWLLTGSGDGSDNSTTVDATLPLISQWLYERYNMTLAQQREAAVIDEACADVLGRFGAGDNSAPPSASSVSEEDRFTFCVLRVDSRMAMVRAWRDEQAALNTTTTSPATDDNSTTTLSTTPPPTIAVDFRDYDECVESDFFAGVRSLAALSIELSRSSPSSQPPSLLPSTTTTADASSSPPSAAEVLDAAILASKEASTADSDTSQEPLPLSTAMYLANAMSDAIVQMEKALATVSGVLGLMRGE